MSDVLYKFRTFKKRYHLDCLFMQRLYFAQPYELNDPFDFKINPDFSLLNTDAKVNEYVKNYLAQIVRLPRAVSHLSKGQIHKELFSYIKSSKSSVQRDFNKVSEELTNLNFGVISFSKTYKNMLLWSHYADNHTGFAIGFKKENIIKNPFVNNRFLCKDVVYTKDYPKISPIETNYVETLFKKSLLKYVDWEYEQEFRIARMFSNEGLDEEKYFNLSLDDIEEVILGMRVDGKYQKKIMNFATKHKIKVFKMYKQNSSFEMKRELIN